MRTLLDTYRNHLIYRSDYDGKRGYFIFSIEDSKSYGTLYAGDDEKIIEASKKVIDKVLENGTVQD